MRKHRLVKICPWDPTRSDEVGAARKLSVLGLGLDKVLDHELVVMSELAGIDNPLNDLFGTMPDDENHEGGLKMCVFDLVLIEEIQHHVDILRHVFMAGKVANDFQLIDGVFVLQDELGVVYRQIDVLGKKKLDAFVAPVAFILGYRILKFNLGLDGLRSLDLGNLSVAELHFDGC